MVSTINPTAQHYIDKIREVCERVKPLVVIHCITYNHEPYLRDALEGFIMQKTDFPFVAIVHEDVSTDGTAHILREYAEKYPDTILPIFEKENQYSKGTLTIIMNEACKATGAKYIAMCEGDDYWTYPLKLQKQVDFLETHPDILYTCHRYDIQILNSPQKDLVKNDYLDVHKEVEGFEFDLNYNFKRNWVTKTLTSVFRLECLDYKELKNCIYYRDTHLIYQILSRGNGYCFQFNGSTYRKQETGVWSQMNYLDQAILEIKKWKEIDSKISTSLSKWMIKRYFNTLIIKLIKNKNFSKLFNKKIINNVIMFPINYIMINTTLKNESERIESLGLNALNISQVVKPNKILKKI